MCMWQSWPWHIKKTENCISVSSLTDRDDGPAAGFWLGEDSVCSFGRCFLPCISKTAQIRVSKENGSDLILSKLYAILHWRTNLAAESHPSTIQYNQSPLKELEATVNHWGSVTGWYPFRILKKSPCRLNSLSRGTVQSKPHWQCYGGCLVQLNGNSLCVCGMGGT